MGESFLCNLDNLTKLTFKELTKNARKGTNLTPHPRSEIQTIAKPDV